MAATTIAELLTARVGDDNPGLRFADDEWSWGEVVQASADRAAIATSLRVDGPFHVGVLLENGPEYLFWLGGAALAGATVVGINPTRRGAELVRDVAHTDCQLVVTDRPGARFLADAGVELPPDRVLAVDEPDYEKLLTDHAGAAIDTTRADASSLFLLLFTSGSTGAPKAVRCTQGRLAAIGQRAAKLYGITQADVYYCAMPLFHGNAIMAVWAPLIVLGACFATRPKFSASGFIEDVRRFGATHFNYVGKTLAYVLATPERPDDSDNSLRLGFGTEASERDIAEFARRFGCRIVEGYGMSEGGTSINIVPGTPPGSLGRAQDDTTLVFDPTTGRECARARFDDAGRLLNPDEAIGEIVNTAGLKGFEGYYNNPEADAERVRAGTYWTGDLGYRDEEGFFYFAGRSSDWLRVDGENFGAAPVERVLARHPDVVMAAVYAVPDARGGDQLMVAFELRPGTSFDPEDFTAFLGEQPDLGTKWVARFVRITEAMPLTGTNKVMKGPLREEGWRCADPVWWRPGRENTFEVLTEDARSRLEAELDEHGVRRG